MRPGVPVAARPVPQPRHATLATIALILGGVAIGTTEFVTMGLLPEIAAGVGVTIPAAGHTISAYAAGVVIGAPLLAVLGATWPRKALLVGLMVAFTAGNVLSAVAPTYETLVGARLLAGLPHGAFFGVAALVAVDLAARGQSGRAVGRVMLGIPIANVLGVPGATWLGQSLGWRSAYWLVALIGVATVGLIAYAVPHLPADRSRTVRSELSALTSLQVWLTLGVGAVGFGGMFAMYSYIAPTVTEVTGLPASAVPVFLLVFGASGLRRQPRRGPDGGLVGHPLGRHRHGRARGVAGAVRGGRAVCRARPHRPRPHLGARVGARHQPPAPPHAGGRDRADARGGEQPRGPQPRERARRVGRWRRHRRRVRLHRPVGRRVSASPRSAWASSASRSSSTAATTRTARPCARPGRSR